jgi:hypothetical protein
MQIQVREITPPRPANIEKGWEAGKTYKVTDTNGVFYYANPQYVTNIIDVKASNNIDIKFKEKVVGGKPMNFVDSITILGDTVAPQPNTHTEPTQTPQNSYQPSTEGTAGGYNVSDLDSRAWSIILQACVNRYPDWTPDQKLRWICIYYSKGASNTFKQLQDNHDLDNTAISEMPDDKIPF